MIDFNQVGAALFNPKQILIAFLFLSFSVLCCSLRWYLLVKAQGLSLSFKNLIALSMIGNFFNTFMPGAVGGDVIKAWYVAGREPQQKTKAIFTVLLDRFIGLAVIIFYAAFTMLFFIQWLETHPELKLVALIIWTFTGLALLGGLLFFTPQLWSYPRIAKLLQWVRKIQLLASLMDATLLYRHHLRSVLISLLLSGASIFGINLLYSIQGSILGIDMPLIYYFFVVPIALVVSAIPLIPGGIGTGQIAFHQLFLWIGMPDPSQGSTLCTVIQIYTISFNCLGAIFYLRFKRSPQSLYPTNPGRPAHASP